MMRRFKKLTESRLGYSSGGLAIACALSAIVLIAGSVAVALFLNNSSPPPESVRLTDRPPAGLSDTIKPGPTTIKINLVGDVNFSDGWGGDVAHAHNDAVAAAFSPEILASLQSADISYANHEFTLSSRGTPLNKRYTFRADPARVDYWKQLGVDVVGLANNHVYDYGEEAFFDTLDILSSHGINYVGAGYNLDEAMRPVYFDIDGYTIAFVAADRSQRSNEPRAPEAREDSPGVLFCVDESLFLAAVTHAHETADFVVAIPHWGIEESSVWEPAQQALGQKLIDAGADAVVGSHPHVLQGVEFYNGKLIAYSLGNFWFNYLTTPTAILSIEITEGVPSFRLIGALQSEQHVLGSQEISQEVMDLMRKLSPNVSIDDNGLIAALA